MKLIRIVIFIIILSSTYATYGLEPNSQSVIKIVSDLAYLESSTIIGGNRTDEAKSGAIDSQNNIIIAGYTKSYDFTVTEYNHHGGYEGFLSKFDNNSTLIWSKYIGGSDLDAINSIAIDSKDNIIVTGYTSSGDLLIENGFDDTYNGNGDVFISKYQSNGSLLWSTYYGGDQLDTNSKAAIDGENNIVIAITTYSTTITDEFTECGTSISSNVVVSKWDQDGELIWISPICGDGIDNAMDLSIDNEDNLLITGYSTSTNFQNEYSFPKTDTTNDVFISKMNKTGSIKWLKYFSGSSDDFSRAITSDGNNNIYITGFTHSDDFMKRQSINVSLKGEEDVFVSKLNTHGVMEWTEIIGGSLTDHACGITINSQNKIFVMIGSKSTNFPMVNSINNTHGGNWDTGITEFSDNGTLLFSTYFGGSSSDLGTELVSKNDDLYLFGYSQSEDIPILNSDTNYSGLGDAFFAKFHFYPTQPAITTVLISTTATETDTLQINSESDTAIPATSNESESIFRVVTYPLLTLGLFVKQYRKKN